ncbi:MAG: hypothetical protein R3F17_16010, partial [Planctomycetota bacterium]
LTQNYFSTGQVIGGWFAVDSAPSPGAQYCFGTPNSTGNYGFITSSGYPNQVSDKILLAEDMPQNQFGYFLCSQGGMGSGTIPGSPGVLCLLGAPLGRYNGPGEIFYTGSTGTGSLTVNPTAFRGPNGPVAATFGQTWTFQAWHRENGGSSNFTNAIQIQME